MQVVTPGDRNTVQGLIALQSNPDIITPFLPAAHIRRGENTKLETVNIERTLNLKDTNAANAAKRRTRHT